MILEEIPLMKKRRRGKGYTIKSKKLSTTMISFL
jgi:hypothetical protein